MMPTLLKIPVEVFAGIIVGTALVLWAFPGAIEDWQFQIAGLADPFLGRPAPGVTVLLGSIASIVVLGIALVRGRNGRRAATRSWWTVPLLAGWVAYGSGAALTLAGGARCPWRARCDTSLEPRSRTK